MTLQFNLADLMERVADTVPDHLALVCGDRRLTFAELDERANRLAHALAGARRRPGRPRRALPLQLDRILEGMLAAFKLRAVPINVNYRYVEDELRYLLDDADAVAVVFHPEFASKLAAIAPSLPKLHTYLAVADSSPSVAGSLDGLDYDDALAGASAVATSRRAPPTTSTSSTRAAPRACRRA